jgi:hypothetical protein
MYSRSTHALTVRRNGRNRTAACASLQRSAGHHADTHIVWVRSFSSSHSFWYIEAFRYGMNDTVANQGRRQCKFPYKTPSQFWSSRGQCAIRPGATCTGENSASAADTHIILGIDQREIVKVTDAIRKISRVEVRQSSSELILLGCGCGGGSRRSWHSGRGDVRRCRGGCRRSRRSSSLRYNSAVVGVGDNVSLVVADDQSLLSAPGYERLP